jgi:hypothetical protein
VSFHLGQHPSGQRSIVGLALTAAALDQTASSAAAVTSVRPVNPSARVAHLQELRRFCGMRRP